MFILNILVDADACPVKQIIISLAKKHGIPVTMFIDTSHELNDGYSTVIMVDKARDSADFALIARAGPGDIVVTQDYGVAAMALARGSFALNQDGLIYTGENMNSLLEQRHLSQKIRRAGGKTGRHPKRTAADDGKFRTALLSLITENRHR